jgi:hypothetical protein
MMPSLHAHLAVYAAAALLAPAVAAAHEAWLAPDRFIVEPGATVSLAYLVGEAFAGEPRPPAASRFVRLGPDGDEELSGSRAITLAAPGGHVVALETRFLVHELPAARFAAHLDEQGLDRVRSLRRARGHSGRDAVERYRRSCKTLLRVAGAGPSGWPRVAGLPLEIVPERDPARGGRLPVRVLHHGRPLAGARIRAWNQRPDGTVAVARARTDARGRAWFRLARGVWLIALAHMTPGADLDEAEWDTDFASLTFAGPP